MKTKKYCIGFYIFSYLLKFMIDYDNLFLLDFLKKMATL
jgi:hypothetical protein